MLHIVKSRIGSGKSRAIIDHIGQAVQAGRHCILIVPDQATFSAEQQLCSQLQIPGFMDIEVLSFNRLALRICQDTGCREQVYLDDRGKTMLLRAAIEDCREQLSVYADAAKRRGFCEKVGRMLSLLESCSITPEMLKARADTLPASLLHAKLTDTAILYQHFTALMEGGFTDNNERLRIASELAGHCSFLANTEIFIDGFELLTVRLFEFVLALLHHTRKVTVSLNVPLDYTDQELYSLSQDTLFKLRKLSKEQYIPVEEELIRRPKNLKAKEIAHLEDHMFGSPYLSYRGACESIHIYMANTREDEVRHAGETILKKVRETQLRYRDFCVLCNDLPAYAPLIARTFADLGVPVFTDSKRPISSHPLVLFILSALRCCVYDYRPGDVCDLLHTKLTTLTEDQSDWLVSFIENYGIRNYELQQGLREGRAAPEDGERFTQLRELLLPPLLHLQKQLNHAVNVREQVTRCYAFLQEQGLEEKLQAYIDRLESLGLPEASDQTAQLWNITMELFDQMELLLGNTKMPPAEFLNVLTEGFASAPAALIPPVLDCVLLGDIARSKSQEVKVSFILGVNDGVLPNYGGSEALLSPRETDQLNADGFGLSPDNNMLDLQHRFDIYSAFTRPKDELYLSYAQSDSGGTTYKPSYLITKIHRLFPTLHEESGLLTERVFSDAHLLTPAYSLLPLAVHIHDGQALPPPLKGLYVYLSSHAEYLKYLSLLDASSHPLPDSSIPSNISYSLFSSKNAISVSRLEEYAKCPFAHFVTYGLRPELPQEYAANTMDIGNLFHSVMEQVSRAARDKGWSNMDRKACYALADEFFFKELPAVHFGALLATARQRHINSQLRNIVRLSAWSIAQQMQGGKFSTFGEEVTFGYSTYPPIEVKTDYGTLYLKGKIDRADIFQIEDFTYVRIVDYKSSKHDFDKVKLDAGLELQLLTYMQAMLRTLGEKSKPAGAFYFTLEEHETDKVPQLNGILLDEPQVTEALDNGTVQPSLYKSSKNKADRQFSADGFSRLLDTASAVTAELSSQMLAGHIAAAPIRENPQSLPCDYCPNCRICRFDNVLYRDNIRRLSTMGGAAEKEDETDA